MLPISNAIFSGRCFALHFVSASKRKNEHKRLRVAHALLAQCTAHATKTHQLRCEARRSLLCSARWNCQTKIFCVSICFLIIILSGRGKTQNESGLVSIIPESVVESLVCGVRLDLATPGDEWELARLLLKIMRERTIFTEPKPPTHGVLLTKNNVQQFCTYHLKGTVFEHNLREFENI